MRRQQVFIIGFGALVVAALVAVVVVSGTPNEVRQQKIDAQRVSDLQQIERAVLNQARTKLIRDRANGATFSSGPYVPADIGILDNPDMGSIHIYDPVTGKKYGYKATGQASYSLCATFDTADDQTTAQLSAAEREWLHPAGEHCFDLVVDVPTLQSQIGYPTKPPYSPPATPLLVQ
jgi:hypothetical protein